MLKLSICSLLMLITERTPYRMIHVSIDDLISDSPHNTRDVSVQARMQSDIRVYALASSEAVRVYCKIT